jgi:uncharacterized membrane protein
MEERVMNEETKGLEIFGKIFLTVLCVIAYFFVSMFIGSIFYDAAAGFVITSTGIVAVMLGMVLRRLGKVLKGMEGRK